MSVLRGIRLPYAPLGGTARDAASTELALRRSCEGRVSPQGLRPGPRSLHGLEVSRLRRLAVLVPRLGALRLRTGPHAVSLPEVVGVRGRCDRLAQLHVRAPVVSNSGVV